MALGLDEQAWAGARHPQAVGQVLACNFFKRQGLQKRGRKGDTRFDHGQIGIGKTQTAQAVLPDDAQQIQGCEWAFGKMRLQGLQQSTLRQVLFKHRKQGFAAVKILLGRHEQADPGLVGARAVVMEPVTF